MNAISATGVTKRYADVTALDDLTLSVEMGSTFGLLGTNGAGKTTLFKLLVGHISPDAGTLEVAGRDVTTAGTDVRVEVGYLPEQAGFPASLSAREVLLFHARIRGLPVETRAERIADVLAKVGLTDAADRAVGGYSNGMQRRLGLATALLPQPRILLLDEPTAGLDPLGVEAFHQILRRLHDETDLTVVLSSHVMTEVEELCESVAVLHDGRLRAVGDIDDLRSETGSDLTVTVRATRESAVTEIRDLVEREGCTVLDTTGRRVAVACPPDAVPALLHEFAGTELVKGYEVSEPGLDDVFERAVTDGGADATRRESSRSLNLEREGEE